ncbi:hypothetical protein QBC40DRAFT_223429 [Triangularia verruculosa]|uniref:Uncharacterized protein n=1 Tax=Triangularia verruculosa TaxID=2587418 RepID=A0AAN7AY02_9PEZI|nr:hypothetical protein QBC40DRAFT_223429 [Triangularia verruculosa]
MELGRGTVGLSFGDLVWNSGQGDDKRFIGHCHIHPIIAFLIHAWTFVLFVI